MRICLLLFFLGFSIFAQSQTNRYFVYFQDKGQSTNPYSLSNPGDYLTEKSVLRREKQSIAIDSTDIPVNPNYVDQLKTIPEVDVFFSSKWMNGVLVQANIGRLSQIENLHFVAKVALMAEDIGLYYEKDSAIVPEIFDPPSRIDDGAVSTDFQLWMLNANRMHEDGFEGENMMITILDNGFRGVNRYEPFQHLWDENQIIASKDFVENSGNVYQFGSHGTQVLSVISALYKNDTVDFQGIAPKASVVLCITEDNKGENRIEEINWVLGAEFADSLGTDIINSSLGYTTFDLEIHNYDTTDLDGGTTIVSRAARMASDKGILVVNSAGNSGNKKWRYISAPADSDHILAIGSVDVDYSKSSFSSFGPTADGRIKPDVSAFGNGTVVVNGSGRLTNTGGTSFSAPLIAGFAAGIWQMNPQWTVIELMDEIKNSGHLANDPNNELGYGVPNYAYIANGRALQVEDIFEDKIVVYPNPFEDDTLFISADKSFKGELSVRIIDPKGNTVYARGFRKKEVRNDLELNIDTSLPGVYYLFLQSGQNKKVVKLINFQ